MDAAEHRRGAAAGRTEPVLRPPGVANPSPEMSTLKAEAFFLEVFFCLGTC